MQKVMAEPALEVARLPSGTLVIDVKRDGYSTYREGSVHNLTELLNGMSSTKRYALITPRRGIERSGTKYVSEKQESEQIFLKIPTRILSVLGKSTVSAYWLLGHWSEPSDPSTPRGCVDKVEYSWLISLRDESISSESWLGACTNIARDYACGPFITGIGHQAVLRAESGDVLRSIEGAVEIERTWSVLARLREYSLDIDLEVDQSLSEFLNIRPSGAEAKTLASEEGIVASHEASPYSLRGRGELVTCKFFIATPHAISSMKMFQHFYIARPPVWSKREIDV